jgi:UDP-galactose transporter B1
MIGVSGAVGQIFIFFTISLFNSYLLTVITTSRKLFSVVLSNFSFNHKFTSIQWLGAALVMVGTFTELILSKKQRE